MTDDEQQLEEKILRLRANAQRLNQDTEEFLAVLDEALRRVAAEHRGPDSSG